MNEEARASYLIHGIVETGQIERSDRSAVPGVRLTSLREALEHSSKRPPKGACASSMSVMYAPGKPPLLWASRAGMQLAPDPWKAAAEVRDLELATYHEHYFEDPWGDCDPWDWAPVDVREDWGHGYLRAK